MGSAKIIALTLFSFFLLSTSLADTNNPVCGKNRTMQDSMNVGLKDKNTKGTIAIFVLHRFGKASSKLKTYYIPDVTYPEAEDIGTHVSGFYWVASSIANFEKVKTERVAGVKKISPYDNGCSCPCGGTCYDQENGGCFCDCDACSQEK